VGKKRITLPFKGKHALGSRVEEYEQIRDKESDQKLPEGDFEHRLRSPVTLDEKTLNNDSHSCRRTTKP